MTARCWVVDLSGIGYPGLYRRRLVKGGPYVPTSLEHGRPRDPVTGELLDRSPRWTLTTGGEERCAFDPVVFGAIAGERIDRPEYEHLLRVKEWAAGTNAPEATPREKIDLLTVDLPF